jgi:hypothetical protein
MHRLVRMVTAVFPYLCFGKKSFDLSNIERHPDVLLIRPDGCNGEQFEASGHKRASRQKVLVVRKESSRHPDG